MDRFWFCRDRTAENTTHLLTVVLGELGEQSAPLLGLQVPQHGGDDGAHMFWQKETFCYYLPTSQTSCIIYWLKHLLSFTNVTNKLHYLLTETFCYYLPTSQTSFIIYWLKHLLLFMSQTQASLFTAVCYEIFTQIFTRFIFFVMRVKTNVSAVRTSSWTSNQGFFKDFPGLIVSNSRFTVKAQIKFNYCYNTSLWWELAETHRHFFLH